MPNPTVKGHAGFCTWFAHEHQLDEYQLDKGIYTTCTKRIDDRYYCHNHYVCWILLASGVLREYCELHGKWFPERGFYTDSEADIWEVLNQ
jgi:hypothetical protein